MKPTNCQLDPRYPLRAGVFVFWIVALTSAVSAQGLRLDDILSTGTARVNLEVEELAPAMIQAVLGEIEEHLEANRTGEAATRAAALAERVGMTDPLYPDVLAIRLQTLARTGNRGAAAETAREYLALAPLGPAAWRAHETLARASALDGEWETAANHYGRILDEHRQPAEFLGRDGLIAAVEAFLQIHKAERAREVLDRLPPAPENATQTYWLLETLLLTDMPDRPIPPPAGEGEALRPAIQLRRALLHELRGEPVFALDIYKELEWERALLDPGEQRVLDARLEALR